MTDETSRADEQERAQVAIAGAGSSACQGRDGETGVCRSWLHRPGPAEAAQGEGIELHVVKLPEAKKGFVLLPRRWVVERSFGWVNRFRRLARDYERLPETLAGLHFVVFSILMLGNATSLLQRS